MVEKGAHSPIRCKIVYCGPPGAGKATSLQKIYRNIHPYRKGEMRYSHRGLDQVIDLGFDAKVGGVLARIHLATVTGALADPQTLVECLRGADGVVFVANSVPNQLRADIESLNFVEQALGTWHQRLESLPHVLQYNKRDAEEALPVEDLERDINRFQAPSHETVAIEGKGVEDALIALLARVIESMCFVEKAGAPAGEARMGATRTGGAWRAARPGPTSMAALEVLRRGQRRAAKKRRREVDKALKMARLFLDLEDYEESLRWAREVLEVEPDNDKGKEIHRLVKEKLDEKIDALYRDACRLLERGDAVGSAEKLEMVLEMHPHHREARDLLEAARKRMVQAARPAPRAARGREPREAGAKETTSRRSAPAQPPEQKKRRLQELMRECEDLYRREDFEGTTQVLKRMKGLAPGLNRVDAFLAVVQKKKAQRVAEMVAEARMLVETGQHEEAAGLLNHALDQDSENEEALDLLEKATRGIISPPAAERREEAPAPSLEEEPLAFFQKATVDMIEESLNLLRPRSRKGPGAPAAHPLASARPDVRTVQMVERDLGFLLDASPTPAGKQRKPGRPR